MEIIVTCTAALRNDEEFINSISTDNEYFQMEALERAARASRVMSAADYDSRIHNNYSN